MELSKAKIIADKYVKLLQPFCERIEIAGSIRRLKPEVKDIEIVCIPKEDIIVIDMFNKQGVRSLNFRALVKQWNIIKGNAGTGKYVRIKLPEGINLDLFICRKENWGLIFAIRTGSAAYSHKVLATGWVRAGFKSVGGMLCSATSYPLRLYEERDLFDLIGVNYIEPEKRNLE